MAVVTIPAGGVNPTPEQARAWCAQLEAGDILFFPQTPVPLDLSDASFLLGQQQTDSSLHKNIAYKPNIDRLSGFDAKTASPAAVERLHGIMRKYSQTVTAFLTKFLSPYEANWQLDYASFRPQEEQGRDLPLRRRNDLLHTDAFPTRPTHGARILRFFNNIHPARTRDWVVSDPFAETVRQFAPKEIAPKADSAMGRAGKAAARAMGLGAAIPSLKRSPYDDFMMRFHNFLKENPRWQAECAKYPFQFPAGSSWMVYTDTVPHAVLAGQYALEQTFLVRAAAMVRPEVSPLRVLEEIAQARLA
ncbi:MAG: Kdo hydroxylase family protein [Acidobacteriaceae bacterium]